MNEDGDCTVPRHVVEELCADSSVAFVVAFGSRATDAARPSSDLDVAVKFVDGLSERERFRQRCRLSATVQRDGGPFVDLSDVDELPVEVAHRALQGEFVCGDRERFQTAAQRVSNSFEEQREDIERRQQAVIRRIADEGLHG